MSDYTPPNGDSVNFIFEEGYSPPSGDNVNFLFGAVASVVSSASIRVLYDKDGFDLVVIRWQSDIDGDYRIEIGGTGVNTGDLMDSGKCIGGIVLESVITLVTVEAASSYTGVGTYRFNIYVKSSDNIWNSYE